LEEAAAVDGAGPLRTLRAIISSAARVFLSKLPLSLPGLATTAILTFVYCWNEFLFALSFTVGPERHTVPVAIALFRGQYQVPWGQVLEMRSSGRCASLVATAPVAAGYSPASAVSYMV
jgi:ABC-type glycerol-3-phosphate transport system permease component